jgi:LytS/YehU family sensor histidine kinase
MHTDHLLAGDGHRPVADYLHPAGSFRAEQLREMANKAELRALQSKINPHFLFNALNAISSSIRLNPDTARQLIFNLSRYLRYNIELKDDEQIDIKKELYQIKDYMRLSRLASATSSRSFTILMKRSTA